MYSGPYYPYMVDGKVVDYRFQYEQNGIAISSSVMPVYKGLDNYWLSCGKVIRIIWHPMNPIINWITVASLH